MRGPGGGPGKHVRAGELGGRVFPAKPLAAVGNGPSPASADAAPQPSTVPAKAPGTQQQGVRREKAAVAAPRPPAPAGATGTPTAARPADRGGAEGLEKIRRAVHQLAARVSSPDGGRSQPPEPRPAVPEPAVPEPAVPEPATVVVAGPPPPPETPAAFWERSYLGQFLLRTVR